MSGDIDITAKFQIINKAKLDSIRNSFTFSLVIEVFEVKLNDFFDEDELIKVFLAIVNATAQ